ncbi:MAG: hypothetical protein V4582_19730 [Pseudomonadota bacterium]
MRFPSFRLSTSLVMLLLLLPAAAMAQAPTRSYAVLSLVGDAIHLYTVRPEVGTHVPGESRHVLPIKDTVFDTAALAALEASIKQVQPNAKTVLLMSQDTGLYEAQNAMFEAPAAHQADRDYLIGLLKERAVSHLLLVTKQRDNAHFKLTNGVAGTGQLEGLGFYIDDTTEFRNTRSRTATRGMVGPFAYIRIRLLDAATLANLGEVKAAKSEIITNASIKMNAMDLWASLDSAEKVARIKALLDAAVREAAAPLLGE